jgi:glycosyltransferase involved in cell wall biosynthesis
LLAHDDNCGLAQARNTAFANATNDYVFVLDADNEIRPDAIAKLLAACVRENAEVAYSLIEKFGNATGVGGEVWNPASFRFGNYIDAMALVRKSAWQRAGGYNQPSDIQGWEDYDLWCKFVEFGFRGVLVPEVLCRYRVHRSSMLREVSDPKKDRLRLAMMKRHPWLRLVATHSARDKIGAYLRYYRIVGLQEAMKTALRDLRDSVARCLKARFGSAPPTTP